MLVRICLFITFCVLFSGKLLAQQPAQTVRGIVIDEASHSPVPFANVILLNTDPVIGTVTDSTGHFMLPDIPVGRYDLRVSYIGYEPSIVREIQVSSARETFLTITIKEAPISLGDVVVRPNINKEQPLNTMATVSARMLSVDEASRFAGGFDDPARLAATFAGVASNVGNNGIAVRGNPPKYLQWRMEGVEIPNPNHFADLSVFGGGGLTALSTNMLANSDFFTGAFPAEYGNALSGVFDIFMRNGNNRKSEHSLGIGVIGVDVSSEGPFKKGAPSSYLFNYRYSTLALIAPLLPETGSSGIDYQDFSFRLNFPAGKAGTFSVWGIGLADGSGQDAKTDSTQWFYDSDKETQNVKQFMMASGVSHRLFINNSIYTKTTLAATVSGINRRIDKINDKFVLSPENRINNKNWNFILSSFINTKFGAKHTNKTGVVLTGLMYNLHKENITMPGGALQTVTAERGFSTLLAAYSSSSVNFTDELTMNAGVHAQIFTLNGHYTIEPRIGFRWQFDPTQSLGIAYGSHSRLERLNYFFTRSDAGRFYNKNLDFTRADHFVLSYDLNITKNIHLKAETYYEHLYDIPVIPDSSFSLINLQDDWFFNHKLVNEGEGRNYGLDVTLEQYLTHGFYFMFTASVFNAKYKGGDGIWRDSRYDRNYVFNFLTGKEWQLGKSKQNILGMNIRFSYQGGDHFSPVDEAASREVKDAILDETNAFSEQLPPSFVVDFTINYKINTRKTTQIISLKVINATMLEEFEGFQYNYIDHTVDKNEQAIFIPNLSYKIEF